MFLLGSFLLSHAVLTPVTIAQVLSYTLLTVSVAVNVVYVPHAGYILANKQPITHTDRLIVGIGLSWLAVTIASLWATASYLTGFGWMRTHPIIGFYIFLYILGGALHITSLRTADIVSNRVERQAWRLLVLAIASGTAAGIATVVFNLESGLGPASL